MAVRAFHLGKEGFPHLNTLRRNLECGTLRSFFGLTPHMQIGGNVSRFLIREAHVRHSSRRTIVKRILQKVRQ